MPFHICVTFQQRENNFSIRIWSEWIAVEAELTMERLEIFSPMLLTTADFTRVVDFFRMGQTNRHPEGSVQLEWTEQVTGVTDRWRYRCTAQRRPQRLLTLFVASDQTILLLSLYTHTHTQFLYRLKPLYTRASGTCWWQSCFFEISLVIFFFFFL